MIAYLRN
jgi:hypothetical protein